LATNPEADEAAEVSEEALKRPQDMRLEALFGAFWISPQIARVCCRTLQVAKNRSLLA
jgi:hypothetical protein